MDIPYSQKFLRDPIFMERRYAKISLCYFRGWTFRVARMCIRLLFRGFNFHGLPVNHEYRENWISRKFPAICNLFQPTSGRIGHVG